MPKSLRKIQTKLNQKRGRGFTAIMEGSRDAKRLSRGTLREDRLTKSASIRAKALQPKVARFQSFSELVRSKDSDAELTVDVILKHIQCYISKQDEELQELEALRRPGRPKSAQEDALRHSLEREHEEFRIGYEIPNLFDKENVEMLKDFKGNASGLARIKTIRITRDGQILAN